MWYQLNGRRTEPMPDGMYPVRDNQHKIGNDQFVDHDGNLVQVSTVFLYIDHNFLSSLDFSDIYEPKLFETMVFGGHCNEWCWRYATYDQAELGHYMVINGLIHGIPMDSLDI